MKSHVSDLVGLAGSIIIDAAAKCATVVDSRDLNTIRSRVEHEGLSFLTITLPSFGQDFERSLAAEEIVPGLFRSFRFRLKIPAFMQGFFELVFDKRTGRLLHEPSIAAIESIRQVSYTFKKLSVQCSDARTEKAIAEFRQCEDDLRGISFAPGQLDDFSQVANLVWSSAFGRIDVLSEGTPKHGPGATCERISGNAKYNHKVWHDRLEPYFPLLETAYSINAADSNEFEQVSIVSEEQESPVRVITVPKTLKGPRIIAIEPVCMQYTQQQLKDILVKNIESGWISGGHVNFTDQSINRSLALTSSMTGEFATIDLSSASDRVLNDAAARMFDSNPLLWEAIQACRTKKAKLPNGDIIDLVKFASMGSALCFPIESMFFFTLCVKALLDKYDLPATLQNAYSVSRKVYVYGDDIIIPADDVAAVVSLLTTFGCKVNSTKSFWTGKFRESCGMDAYDGHEVTPTYVRHLFPNNRRNANALISLVEASNHFYRRGYWKTSAHILHKCERLLGTLPIVGDHCAGLGKVSFQANAYTGEFRYNRHFQYSEVRVWKPTSVHQKDELSGYGALQKCLLQLETRPPGESSQQDKHLLQSARHGAVTLKRRWVRPY